MDWVTTTTILEGLRDYGNRDAWDRLVGRFRRPIAAFARQTGVSPRDCEDVAQEALAAFAEAYRAGRYDRTRGKLSGWLFGIAYRHAQRRRRAEARHPPAPGGGDPEPIRDEAGATDVWTRIWDRHLLESAIGGARHEFAPDTFRAFELVVLEDRAPADAAAALGVPVKTVYNAKHRVLHRVRELVRELEEIDVLP
ncbi:hypothetical protein K8I85_10860 [bacterium]|nr:hypothetical protein [bacterium]